MFSFYWPFNIILLPLPWIVSYFFSKKSSTNNTIILKFPRIEKLQAAAIANNYQQSTNKIINLLWYLFWLALVLTAMRPEIVQTPQFTKQYGYDLMLAVDLSRSMSALDFTKDHSQVTRLQAVKEVVAKFVQQRRGDRLGLIVFAAAAYPYVPLTFDIAAISRQLEQLVVGMAGDSTALGDAIGLAVKNLQHKKGEKILIILTDGDDNSSSIAPLQAAQLAAKHHIKIYTIGVGSNGMVPIRDNDGNMVLINSSLDEKLLKKIAKITGGNYSRATDTNSLKKIYQQIDKLEQHEGINKVVMIRTTLHYYFLGCALIALLGLLLMYRRYSNAIS